LSNPYLDRKPRIGDHGRKSEKRVAKKFGASMVSASGATRAKGDMTLGQFLIESKSTSHNSMSVQFAWLAKIEKEALAVGKTPALTVSFLLPGGSDVPGGRWVMMPEDTFQELVNSEGE